MNIAQVHTLWEASRRIFAAGRPESNYSLTDAAISTVAVNLRGRAPGIKLVIDRRADFDSRGEFLLHGGPEPNYSLTGDPIFPVAGNSCGRVSGIQLYIDRCDDFDSRGEFLRPGIQGPIIH